MSILHKCVVAVALSSTWPVGCAAQASPPGTSARRTEVLRVGANAEPEKSPLDALIPHIGPRDADSAAPGPAQYDEIQTRRAIQDAAFLLMANRPETLTKLDDIMAAYLMSGERSESGLDKLSILYARLDGFHFRSYRMKENAEIALGAIAKWQALRPDSPFPRVLKAMMLLNRADAAFAGSTPATVYALDADQPTTLAQNVIDELDRMGPSPGDAQPDIVRIRARALLGASSQELLELVEAASRRNPSSVALYGMGALAMVTNARSPGLYLERVARLAADRTRSEGSNVYYVRTYWSVLSWFDIGSVRGMKIDWRRFAEGSRELVRRYPVQWNIQHLAAIACTGRSKTAARQLIAGVSGRPLPSAWGQVEHLDRCRTWVSSTGR